MAESGPGAQTSEYGLTKLLVWAGIAMTVASVVVPHLDAMFVDLRGLYPDVSWLGKVGAAVAVVAKVVYELGRLFLKARQIQADATVTMAKPSLATVDGTAKPASPP